MRADTDELFAAIYRQIEAVQLVYIEATKDLSKAKVPAVNLKNTLENLRTVMDYCAVGTAIWLDPTADPSKVHFPYGVNRRRYRESLDKNLPKIDVLSPEMADIFARSQPHVCGTTWLIDLCEISNQMKHRWPVQQQVQPQEGISLFGVTMGLNGASMEGCVIEAPHGVFVQRSRLDFNESLTAQGVEDAFASTSKFRGSGFVTRRVEWVDIKLDQKGTDALKLLRTSTAALADVANRVWNLIERGPLVSPLASSNSAPPERELFKRL